MARFDEFEAFARVAESKSFTVAAGLLGISKSQVSKLVARLEGRLGTALFNRSTRAVALTEAGRVFYERVRVILDDIDDASREVSHLTEDAVGTLRVTAPLSFGLRFLQEPFRDFFTQHPLLRGEIDLSDQQVDIVGERLDLAIRIGRTPDSNHIVRRLARMPMELYASPGWLKKHGRPTHPDEIDPRHCLAYAYQTSGRAWRLDGPDGQIDLAARGRVVANNGEILVTMACAEVGILFAPRFLVIDELASGRLQRVLPGWGMEGGLWAVFAPSRQASAKVRLLVDFLAESFKDAPWLAQSLGAA